MIKYRFMTMVTAIACLVMTSGNASALEYWKELGCHNVSRGPGSHVVDVGRSAGSFKAIRLRAKHSPLRLREVEVTFGNGKKQNIFVESVVMANKRTGTLDLSGNKRFISKIRPSYGSRRGGTSLCVEGLVVIKENWVELGCKSVGFLGDTDIIRVAGARQNFDAIRLRVINNTVRIKDVDVRFKNGSSQDVPVNSKIRAGEQTGALDLDGKKRNIDIIRMKYRSRPSFKGKAIVCVDGRRFAQRGRR